MNIVEGLAGGGFAIITKTHHAMVDGISAVDIAQVILDTTPIPRETKPDHWRPRAEPGPVDLVVDAVRDLVSRPGAVLDTARMGVNDARATALKVVSTARRAGLGRPGRGPTGAVEPTQRVDRSPAPIRGRPHLPGRLPRLSGRTSRARSTTRSWRRFREHCADGCSRAGRRSRRRRRCGAMVPLSVRTGSASELGNRVSSYLVDLPVGEPNPLVRLTQISYAMAAHKESGQSVGADALIALVGFCPADAARAGRSGREQLHPAPVQPGRHQRSRTAVPAVRGRSRDAGDVPDRAAGRWPGRLDRI